MNVCKGLNFRKVLQPRSPRWKKLGIDAALRWNDLVSVNQCCLYTLQSKSSWNLKSERVVYLSKLTQFM